ncbi:MAG TPA: carboxypeptidase regulatory-like domain-containing protein [Terracidiphilus sp.]|nr:carboxypeptidase regulatory-like domain-containing protein [Terracidiphilus sp.]
MRKGISLLIARATIFTLLAFLSTGALFAQNAQGTIQGHVTDSSGAAVSGATVMVRNVDTSASVTLVTNASGDYVASALNPGNYTVTVEAANFGQQASSHLVLEVQQTLRQDFHLTVGKVTNTVEVSGETQMLHTDDETIGQVVTSKLIESLPLNGRDFTNLMITNVGTNITPGGSGVDWAYHGLNQEYGEVSADGGQAQSTSYSVDGVYDADALFSVPINIPNELSIQEFKMMNGLYGAQYGQGAAQVNVAIKSGTNSLHGAAYETAQSAWLEPDNAYQAAVNRATGSTVPVRTPFHQNQFGGALSGPLTIPYIYNGHDRTFWFVSYDEGLFNKVKSADSAWVPSTAEIGGDFSAWPFPIYDPATTKVNPAYDSSQPESPTNSPVTRTAFPGNKIPTGRIDPVAAKIAGFWPGPNISNESEAQHILGSAVNYSANTKTTKKQGIGTVRFDQYLGKNDHIYLTGNWGILTQTSTSIAYGQGGQLYDRPKLFGGTWTHIFSPTTLNQATLGYTRNHFLTGTNTAYGPNLSAQAGLANTAPNPVTFDLPNVSFSNGGTGSKFGFYQSFGGGEPTTYADNIYQGVDTLTLVRGRHTLNLGIDVRRMQLFELDNYLGTGSLSFNGQYTALVPGYAGSAYATNGAYSSTAPYQGNPLADFLLGDTSSATGPPPLGTDDWLVWGTNWNVFLQDDYHATDRLTLNAGLRWERPGNFHSAHSDGFAFNTANGGQFVWADCGFTKPILAAGGNPNFLQCGASNTLVPIDNKDFAPRFGFAYRVPGTERFVVRGGFGLFYGLYNRYYDGSQFNKNSLYNSTAATYNTPTGNETQSTAVLKNLWSSPLNANQLFVTPGWEFPYNQVNWPSNHNPYDEQWSLDTEYSLTSTLLLDIGYVGGHGLRQPSQDILGVAAPPKVAGDTCNSLVDISQATGDNASCLKDPNFQPMDTREPYANMPPYLYGNRNGFQSTYNALQVQLIQREQYGLTYHVNYAYSKTMDLTSGINLINGEPGLIQDPHNPYQEYGLSASDQTHRLVGTYAYEIPHHLSGSKFLNVVLGGWTTSGVYQVASGFPFAVYGGVSADQMGEFYGSRYLANSTYQTSSGFKRSLTQWFDTSKYSSPVLGRYGNTNKSPERGPYYTNFDASFGKTTHLTERQALLLRAEIFNVGSSWHSNTNELIPDQGVTDSNFGALVNGNYGALQLYTPYTLQLTAQYSF